MNRESFLEENKRFFENDLIKEVFYNNYISILNVADMFYLVTDYSKSEGTNDCYGLILDTKTLNYISKNDVNYYKVLKIIPKELFVRKHLILSDKAYNKFIELKRDTMINGPTKYIDRKLEEKWSKKMDLRGRVR